MVFHVWKYNWEAILTWTEGGKGLMTCFSTKFCCPDPRIYELWNVEDLRSKLSFSDCRTASLWGRRSSHLQMHFCGPQHSTLTIWEVWFHKTNKSCPHFPNFAVLQNKNVFSWKLLPLCKELASWWLAVAFRIRSCFLCSHTLWLHLTDARCLNCPFIHGSSLKEGHRLAQCPLSSYSLPYSGRQRQTSNNNKL